MSEQLYAYDNPRLQADNSAGETIAKNALAALEEHYPGWGWHVMVRGGILMIRLPLISTKWGMNTRLTEFDHDATTIKKRVIMAAGEFLERANTRRGGFKGYMPNRIDGMPTHGNVK